MNMRALLCLPVLLGLLVVGSAGGETIEALVPAAGPARETAAVPAARLLIGAVANESFDGATLTRVVFQNGPQTFRYSPPGGWKIKSGEHTELTQGAYKASLALALTPAGKGAAASEAERRAKLARTAALRDFRPAGGEDQRLLQTRRVPL